MSPATDTPIRIDNGEITVDAAFLAPKLGLSVEALRAEMGRGAVVGVAEEGRDEDAGRTRVTFRHGARIWRGVIEPDGRLAEAPPPGRRGAPSLLDLVRRATWD